VRTFADRTPDPACDAWAAERGIVFAYAVSASTGVGVDALRDGLPSAVGTTIPAEAEVVLASRRQADALAALAEDVAEAARALRDGAGPVVAIELTLAGMGHLDRLVGRDSREAVLDRLFSRFCIGK
jgi:tRNA modification GTPase